MRMAGPAGKFEVSFGAQFYIFSFAIGQNHDILWNVMTDSQKNAPPGMRQGRKAWKRTSRKAIRQ